MSDATGPTVVELAWAAGLFEGEGCFSIHTRATGTKQVVAKLAMTDEDVVLRFHAVIGVGTVTGRTPPPEKNRKRLFTWQVHEASEVRRVAAVLLPYLGSRRTAKALEVMNAAQSISLHPSKRTQCPKGHPYHGSNLGVGTSSRGNYRYCRSCRAAHKAQKRREVRQ